MSKPVKGFIISNEAWYCQKPETHLPEDEIMIGKYYEDEYEKGTTDGEFSIVWNDIAPQLQVFQDAFKTLSEMPELINKLAKVSQEITPNDLAKELLDIGYVDLTERTKQI